MDAVQIAHTILQQIKAVSVHTVGRRISGAHAMICCGFNKPRVLAKSKNNFGGLGFDVSGMVFQGHVSISLAFDDTYTIEFWNPVQDRTVAELMAPTNTLKGIYCDQLTEVLDSHIETGR
jgi:hypothetical protein